MIPQSHKRRRRGLASSKAVRIGLGTLVFVLLPNAIGFQDRGALLVRQPAVTERVREHMIASPFGTHSRRHVLDAAPGRHRYSTAAGLCIGEFRPRRYRRLDWHAAFGRCERTAAFPVRQP